MEQKDSSLSLLRCIRDFDAALVARERAINEQNREADAITLEPSYRLLVSKEDFRSLLCESLTAPIDVGIFVRQVRVGRVEVRASKADGVETAKKLRGSVVSETKLEGG